MTFPATYVLPLRWHHDEQLDEPTAYLAWLGATMEVIVVDGSPPAIFERHHHAWRDLVTHARPDPRFSFTFGKVNGVMTGIHMAGHDLVVVADDDVRYDEDALRRSLDLLAHADVVIPQNYFDPLVWHARWDTARTLLNRSVSHDWPGTLALRRSTLLEAGGYDGDVLFENLELVRTVVAAGGSCSAPLDLFVRRLPPTTTQFWSQRVRQAYDELARPPLLAGALALLPAVAALLSRRRLGMLAATAAVAVSVAETGRRRGSGTAVFPASASLLAPCWLIERAICSWAALVQRVVFGGVRYGDVTIARAATPQRELRRRLDAASKSLTPASLNRRLPSPPASWG